MVRRWQVLGLVAILLVAAAALGGCSITINGDGVGLGDQYRASGDLALAADGLKGLYIKSSAGPVTVDTWDQPQVKVEYVKKVRAGSQAEADRALAAIQVTLEKDGDAARLVAQWPQGWNRYSSNVELRVHAPAAFGAEVHTGAGTIDLSGLQGDLQLESGAGDVTARGSGSRARVAAHSGAGSIDLTGFAGSLRAETGAGSIQVAGDAALAGLYAHTGSGSLTYRGALAAGSNNRLETGVGSIDVRLQGGADLDASSGAGSVTVRGAGVGGGSVTRHSFAGPVGGGGARLYLHSGAGSIDVQS